MAEAEGVIKYRLDFSDGLPPPAEAIAELENWRKKLMMLGVVGQDPARYGGYGFGNLSRRWPQMSNDFVITGSQTGGLAALMPEHYARVTDFSVPDNHVVASGKTPPSSESLTHGWIYQLCPGANFVFHVHSPEIWHNAEKLGLPVTDPSAAYGTPEMAQEVYKILLKNPCRAWGMLAMGGHEDGIVSFAETADRAGSLIIGATQPQGRFVSLTLPDW